MRIPGRLTADDVMTGREVAALLHIPGSTVDDLARRAAIFRPSRLAGAVATCGGRLKLY